MAEATAAQVEKEVVTTKLVKVITLVLTEEEAEALKTVCNFVGGDPKVSRRRHLDAINTALRSAIGRAYDKSDISPINRSIWFNEELLIPRKERG